MSRAENVFKPLAKCDLLGREGGGGGGGGGGFKGPGAVSLINPSSSCIQTFISTHTTVPSFIRTDTEINR